MRSRATAFVWIPALLLAAVAGCTTDEKVGPVAEQDVAQPSYDAPDGAPAFCERLASSAELGELPTSIGILVAGPDVEARTQVNQVVQELRDVRAGVSDRTDYESVATALDGLIAALDQVIDGGVTDAARAAVSAGLEQVGVATQPVCEFPT